MRLTCIVGARPNFMKVAPILDVARRYPELKARLVHTGQHYDERMSDLFFRDLGLPRPDVYLGVGSGSHAEQTARVMTEFDRVLNDNPADIVLVVGDVNSTIACALVAVKRGIRVAHVEAGLRSFDRTMPEEINRILTDQISAFLFTTERGADNNLKAEGIPEHRVFFVGNVMIDSLQKHREAARRSPVLSRLGLRAGEYALCTLHRPSNVDDPESAEKTVRAVEHLATRLHTVLPIHPRTHAKLEFFGLLPRLAAAGVQVIEPQGYVEFMALMDGARVVLTDSGGIQEETTVLGVPCLTYRDNTERPVTVTEGTNTLVGTNPDSIPPALDDALSGPRGEARIPELWDGHASERIINVLRGQPI